MFLHHRCTGTLPGDDLHANSIKLNSAAPLSPQQEAPDVMCPVLTTSTNGFVFPAGIKSVTFCLPSERLNHYIMEPQKEYNINLLKY